MLEMNIVIIGSTISGNKGAAAMFESAVQTINEHFPNNRITLLSYYPKEDKLKNNHHNVSILSAKPLYLALIINPLALLFSLFKKFHLPNNIFFLCAEIKALNEADIVLDQGGVTFIDGREKYLPFNIACILPPIVMGKIIIKTAQAIGPFDKKINRFFAKLLLPHINIIISRGRITLKHLKSLKLQNLVLGTDYAFILAEKKIRNIYNKKQNEIIIGISPSSVIQQYNKKSKKTYKEIISEFINNILAENKNYKILLIPHSTRINTRHHKNNDLVICEEIVKNIEKKYQQQIHLVKIDLRPGELRFLIRQCDYFITSRFHAMISSLATITPTIVIGWSHKYKEILEEFNLEKYMIDYKNLTTVNLKHLFELLIKNKEEVVKNIEKKLPATMKKAQLNVQYIKFLLQKNEID